MISLLRHFIKLWRAAHLQISDRGSSHRLTSYQRSSFFNTNLTHVHSVEYLPFPLEAGKALLPLLFSCELALVPFTPS